MKMNNFPNFLFFALLFLVIAKGFHVTNGTDVMKDYWPKMCKNLTENEYESLFPANVDKYIFPAFGGCGGLANQMFRFASLYGIGKPYGRKPIFKEDQKCGNWKIHNVEGENEMEMLFPVFASQIKYFNPSDVQNDIYSLHAFSGCQAYEDPQKYAISEIEEKYLEIDADCLQSYKYFASRKMEIRQLFQIGSELCEEVGKFEKELFKDDHEKAYRFCVHTRMGDIIKDGWNSEKDFTEQGIEFGFKYLKEKLGDISISVVLMGEDKDFLKNLTINRQLIAKVYVPKPMMRRNDLAFAITACDSLLITAPLSTFSWWIGYLMADDAPIFYDAKREPHQTFPPEWIPITILMTTTITAEEGSSTTTITAEEGSSTTTITAEEGSSTTTITAEEGSSTTTITAEEGSSTTTITAEEGSSTTTTTAEKGSSKTTIMPKSDTTEENNAGKNCAIIWVLLMMMMIGILALPIIH